MGYVYFTEEQKERANSVDLVDFLQRNREKLLPSGREKRWERDHSVTVRGNRWYDHAVESGGGPISFVQRFYGLRYPEAVSLLLDGEQGIEYRQAEQTEPEPAAPFKLPPANQNMRRAYAYLLKQRYLDREVLNAFAKKGLLYESLENSRDGTKQYHNAIFVGRDEDGIARHAHKKGIYTFGKSYRGNIESSDPRHSFHWNGTSEVLYVFESPIDMLSYISLHKEGWQRHSYVALCGVGKQAIDQMLKANPGIKVICLCLDHDIAGMKAMDRIEEHLRDTECREIKRELSVWKDWNEDCKAAHGQEAQPADRELTEGQQECLVTEGQQSADDTLMMVK